MSYHSNPSVEQIVADAKRGKKVARKLLKERHGVKRTVGFRFDAVVSSREGTNGIVIAVYSPDWKGHEQEVIWSIIT